MAFTLVNVTGWFVSPSGTPATGSVTATLTKPMTNGATVVDCTPITVTLNDAGQLSGLVLAANDDAGTTPQETMYTFTLQLDHAAVQEFQATVSCSTPTVDFSALEQAAAAAQPPPDPYA